MLFSPILHTISKKLNYKGLTTEFMGSPGSILTSNQVLYGFSTINKKYYLGKLLNKITNLLGIKVVDQVVSIYSRILVKNQVKLVLSIGSIPELCAACRINQIEFVEILHGIGYTNIEWGYKKRQERFLPNTILCLDDISKSTFSELNFTSSIRVNNPFIASFYEINFPQRFNQVRNRGSVKNILISLQWGYDGTFTELAGVLTNHIIPEELLNSIRLNLFPDVEWHFRMHPVQVKSSKYKSHLKFIDDFCLQNPKAHWRWATESSLPELLIEVDGHITMSSMTSYEASYFGVKTLALCPSLRNEGFYQDMFNDLVDKGYLLKSPIDSILINDWIDKVSRVAINDDFRNSLDASDYIFGILYNNKDRVDDRMAN